MLRIQEVKRQACESADCLPQKIERQLKLPKGCITQWRRVKESVDARDKSRIMLVCSVDFSAESIDEEQLLSRAQKRGWKLKKAPQEEYVLFHQRKEYQKPEQRMLHRPVVVGFGPCGIFCALLLAQMGYAPLVLERGKPVEQRAADVERFWRGEKVDPESNVQFGEGGAGTFSDGKLTTQIKDSRIHKVIEEMVAAGGGEELRYRQKPHVGTDVLRNVVVQLRREILRLGGEILFETKLTGLRFDPEGRVCAVEAESRKEPRARVIPAEVVVLALGHSARDTFEALHRAGLSMEQKPFSMGVRIEHWQEMIDCSQYGAPAAQQKLGAAEYKLSHKCKNGRGVYTFCMCPGGRVIASASSPQSVVTNGMSYRSRSLPNANSGLLVDVRTEDFGSEHPLAGMRFQEYWEHQAFLAGGSSGCAPAQRAEDFLAGQATEQGRGESNSVRPSYAPGVAWTSLDACLPAFACESLREALPVLGKKLAGFDSGDSVLTGIETRSSSPVRIVRSETLQTAPGVFPGGEGAGYAGGITSAAVDGIRIAEQIAALWLPAETEKPEISK